MIMRFSYLYILLLLWSCEGGGRIDLSEGWNKEDVYEFNYEVVDSTRVYDLLFYAEFGKQYYYNSFAFLLEVTSPNFLTMRDTIYIKIDSADTYFISRRRYSERLVITDMSMDKGFYNFKLKQIVNNELWGVEKCKLLIVPSNRKIDGER